MREERDDAVRTRDLALELMKRSMLEMKDVLGSREPPEEGEVHTECVQRLNTLADVGERLEAELGSFTWGESSSGGSVDGRQQPHRGGGRPAKYRLVHRAGQPDE